MKRFIAIIVICAFLIGIAVFEELYAKNFINTLTQKAENIEASINLNKENIDNEKVNNSYNDLKAYWDKSKKVLCYFTNYEKIKNIDESIVKIDIAIEYNEISLAIENITVIKEYEQIFKNIIGFNINNLL